MCHGSGTAVARPRPPAGMRRSVWPRCRLHRNGDRRRWRKARRCGTAPSARLGPIGQELRRHGQGLGQVADATVLGWAGQDPVDACGLRSGLSTRTIDTFTHDQAPRRNMPEAGNVNQRSACEVGTGASAKPRCTRAISRKRRIRQGDRRILRTCPQTHSDHGY